MKTNELIFVILERQGNVFTAMESNHGIVVFGGSIAEIQDSILLKVREYFNGEFSGEIRIRRFRDTVITI